MKSKTPEKRPIIAPYSDYVQSANALFHFMEKREYLEWILNTRAMAPRYCIEDIEYLNIEVGGRKLREAAVLQKCFCDIPFHKLMDSFDIRLTGDDVQQLTEVERLRETRKKTHPDCYGKYAIALSKYWGEKNGLQPVQYINPESVIAKKFAKLFSDLWNEEELPDNYADDVLNRLAFMKPLRGAMERFVKSQDEEGKITKIVKAKLHKNFHDECEWRYVPDFDTLAGTNLERISANPKIKLFINDINKNLSKEQYQLCWLKYDYDDVRYIIVPDLQARLDIIQNIWDIPNEQFGYGYEARDSKSILISKILVLEEIKKDW